MFSKKEDEEKKLPESQKEDAIRPAPSSQISREQQYDDVIASAKSLFLQKNEEYGDAIAETGVLGAVVSIVGLNARLKKIVLSSPDAGKSQKEALKDIVKDSLNYAAIAGIMIMDNNWKPE